MQNLLFLTIMGLGTWAALRLWQVSKLTVRYEQVRRKNIEQDPRSKG